MNKTKPVATAGKAPGQKQILQWHPAFYADVQIELAENASNLMFENEHQLSTKPMEVDVVIIKKEAEYPIHKNIGRIFRKYNLIEYKSPEDYLSIDDFYKIYGYACFYKADTETADSISIGELTITFVCHQYPRMLSRHLENIREYSIEEKDEGIYYIKGDIIPIQLLVISELSPEKNLWLSSLADRLSSGETVRKLLKDYRGKQKNPLYRSVMDIIVRANKAYFEEVNGMCDALEEMMEEMMKDKLEEMMKDKVEDMIKDKMDCMKEQAEEQARSEVTAQMNTLILKLSQLGRIEELVKAASDEEYEKRLFEEFGLLPCADIEK